MTFNGLFCFVLCIFSVLFISDINPGQYIEFKNRELLEPLFNWFIIAIMCSILFLIYNIIDLLEKLRERQDILIQLDEIHLERIDDHIPEM